jgi:hypothetical protein
MPSALPDGSSYNVTVYSQPAAQTCTVSQGSGTVAGSSISNAQVSCSTFGGYLVGLTVSGQTGSFSMSLYLGGTLYTNNFISQSGSYFSFYIPASVATLRGTQFTITADSQPPGQSCTATPSSGDLTGTNVVYVDVTCR